MIKIIIIVLVLSSTIIHAQNAIRPIVGYGMNEGMHVGLCYRMTLVQLYAGYGRFETSPTYDNAGHFFWGGIQIYFGKSNKSWRPWYLKLGLLRSQSLSEYGERENQAEFRIGREIVLDNNFSLAVDLGFSRYFEDRIVGGGPQGGVYFLYNFYQ